MQYCHVHFPVQPECDAWRTILAFRLVWSLADLFSDSYHSLGPEGKYLDTHIVSKELTAYHSHLISGTQMRTKAGLSRFSRLRGRLFRSYRDRLRAGSGHLFACRLHRLATSDHCQCQRLLYVRFACHSSRVSHCCAVHRLRDLAHYGRHWHNPDSTAIRETRSEFLARMAIRGLSMLYCRKFRIGPFLTKRDERESAYRSTRGLERRIKLLLERVCVGLIKLLVLYSPSNLSVVP